MVFLWETNQEWLYYCCWDWRNQGKCEVGLKNEQIFGDIIEIIGIVDDVDNSDNRETIKNTKRPTFNAQVQS
jgi:hypothetical protein